DTPGRTAPLESRMVPTIAPVLDWPNVEVEFSTSVRATTSGRHAAATRGRDLNIRAMSLLLRSGVRWAPLEVSSRSNRRAEGASRTVLVRCVILPPNRNVGPDRQGRGGSIPNAEDVSEPSDFTSIDLQTRGLLF